MIYLLSPRGGGPYKQLKLVSEKLNERGYDARHCYSLKDWLKLHFNRKDIIVSVIPFFFVVNKKNLILNIRGNYRREKKISNPLSYLYDRNLKAANRTIVPSEYLKNELNLRQAVVIPTSTKIKETKVDYRDDKVVRLATITNFDFRPKAQGINKLINIVNQINSNKKIEIHVYGGGRWLQHAKEQYELHNYKKYPVTFHGKFEEAINVLPGNDIFIYWSTFDNMPNVLIEATTCGLPIVVNKYAAYEEVVGSDNLLAHNEHEFTQQLINLIEDSTKRKRYGLGNKNRAKLFDIDKNIEQWINVITKPRKVKKS